MREYRHPMLVVLRRPSQHRSELPWVTRCGFMLCQGWTSYHATHGQAITAALTHTREHWRVSAT